MADVVWLRNALDNHELAALDKITETGGRPGGRLDWAQPETAAGFPSELCTAERGDIQILPMLVLHRSRPSQSATPRRALRLDYAAQNLPPPLEWHAR
jgi:hypothetical protein